MPILDSTIQTKNALVAASSWVLPPIDFFKQARKATDLETFFYIRIRNTLPSGSAQYFEYCNRASDTICEHSQSPVETNDGITRYLGHFYENLRCGPDAG